MSAGESTFWRHLTKGRGLPAAGLKFADDEPPLRSDLYSADQMEQHGKSLAAMHTLESGKSPDRLLKRLADNERVLLAARDLTTEALKTNRRITPAGEWLVDNFYLIDEQIRTARLHFPKSYSEELPRLASGPSAKLPRVYDLAIEAVAHGDGRIDDEGLRRFLAAYQSIALLTLGELTAVSIMLRLALIENLRRVGARIALDRIHRNRADFWADRMTAAAESDPKSLILSIADMARSNPPMVSSFVAEFARRLQGQSSALALPLTWVEQYLADSGQTIEQMVNAETQQQAADQVSIGNSIGSLRSLGATDWRDFLESLSTVESALRTDANGVYAGMDFVTRDRYRHVVERIARNCAHSETDVAQAAIGLARRSAQECGPDCRAAHVGYYLIDKGLAELERALAVRLSIGVVTLRVLRRAPLLTYAGAVIAFSLCLTAVLMRQAFRAGLSDWQLALLAMLLVTSASQLAVALVNLLASFTAAPHSLPRLDLSAGIPISNSTLVVVPTMLSSARHLDLLLEAMEVRYHANHDEHLHFGLLTDFPDATAETLPGDAPLLLLAKAGIEALNAKYAPAGGGPFVLFHRPRRWNPRDRIWMGYERKRGKLGELNALLRGSGHELFSLLVGDIQALQIVKYVITLDTDTQLPRDAARLSIATMAHPLNRARFNEATNLVVDGYGILQPRVAASFTGANRSRYARMCGGEPGIDPYTRAVSDVYQDLFGEGSFIGKGIYEVDAFERALAGRFPENRILSHDLLEGCYARSGLMTDVQFYEADPSRYSDDVSRRRRWIRGDWQIARWLFPRVPGLGSTRIQNPLSALSKWKMLDNLRRSVVPAAITLLAPVAWFLLPNAWAWTAVIAGVFLIPACIASIAEVFQKPRELLWSQHLASSLHSAQRRLSVAVFSAACVPYEAYYGMAAIVRTLWRVVVARRRLLEWAPSGGAEQKSAGALPASLRAMWICPAIAAAIGIMICGNRPSAVAAASPLLILWLMAPVVAWWLSLPLMRQPSRLAKSQVVFLGRTARRTWSYFDTMVGPADHWLPPDNYQEHPLEVTAHRTSPTNIGLSLLANLAAYDFGYIPAGELIERTAGAFDTMTKLGRHRGHFFNWYDTLTLEPLSPVYVSTVDSGNLAGHLLTLRPGLLALADAPILHPRVFDGISDTFGLLIESLGAPPSTSGFATELQSIRASPPVTLTDAKSCFDRLVAAATQLSTVGPDKAAPSHRWATALMKHCEGTRSELVELAPWTELSVQDSTRHEFPALDIIPTFRELAGLSQMLLPAMAAQRSLNGAANDGWFDELGCALSSASASAALRIQTAVRLAEQAGGFAVQEYDFLFDKTRRLLAIGYNVGDCRRDPSFYDLLASEARLCVFVAIAQGQLPQESWFALGRRLLGGSDPILLSWSGSMFEYLMPLLVMPTYLNTLLDQTCRSAVARQIAYGKLRRIPWGISESGYNLVDAQFNYQYRAFGVPGLGLKRGLAEDVVVSPYSTVMALMIAPEEACLNLERLAGGGFEGGYGFYEAIDYTPSRVPRGSTNAVVRSFMAHHQGMSLLSLAYVLLDRPMQRRFESDPQFRATMLLLQERIPKATASQPPDAQSSEIRTPNGVLESPLRVITNPNASAPEVQLLSNGRYHVMITHAGGGYSRRGDMAVTRWREDATRDNWGAFLYVRDTASGEFWSTAYQPTLAKPDTYEAIFSEGRAEFRRRDQGIDLHTEIAVSPEEDIELRRITIHNRSRTRRSLDVTSYAEVVLTSAAADALHPAFSNLFVQTEIARERHAILCHRRPRSANEPTPWMFHLMTGHGGDGAAMSYETDRARFLGRRNTAASPDAMTRSGALSGSEGSVLDPIVAIRCPFTLEPEEAITLNIVFGIGDTREAALDLVNKYQDARLADRVFDLAWTHGQVVLRQINASESDAQQYARLAGSVIFSDPTLRTSAGVVERNRRGQSGLWGHSISGDLPIVLLQIADAANVDLVRQLVQAHAYWRLKGLVVDLVIWNEDQKGYRQLLHDQIFGLIAGGIDANLTDRAGGIFVRHTDQMSNEDRMLLQTVARAVISDARGTLDVQINRHTAESPSPRVEPELAPTKLIARRKASSPPAARDLIFENGLGGFTHDGREYVITTGPEHVTPAPWSNVLANAHFGTVVSESSLGYTWSENAHEFRLSPWANDPLSDSSGEALYLRDEETGQVWSPTPLPASGVEPYVTRHGFGYTIFEHTEAGIQSDLSVYVALDAPVKFCVLKMQNQTDRARKLSATAYVEWVLGDLRPKSTMHIVTEVDAETGALFARNAYNSEFFERIAFLNVDDPSRTLTGDRREFIGRNGTLANPAALSRVRLSGRTGATLDPCGALQVEFQLGAGQRREIVFTLGAGNGAEDVRRLAAAFRDSSAARSALEAVWKYWSRTLGAVYVETPDPSVNVLANGWLLYQTLACRLWARSGYYQSGGAFGFRDQLQDTMALIHAEPALTRAQILLCAGRQFREGDAQHWWHPPAGRGVRTRCSDDFLWLVLAACRYVQATADTGVLDESIPFLEGRTVNADEDSYYDLPGRSDQAATLYEHCLRAIRHGLRTGAHGLPLMGCGDWNDGMNLVGEKGTGESVWLGFFFYQVLTRFSEIARQRGDAKFAAECTSAASALRVNIESNAWDGDWYRRAYFDDGTPLGSAGNDECQIDSIAQSWAVLSGAADPARARRAMESVDRRLVRRSDSLIQLLDPPFDVSNLDPGYIKGYVPGVRENGGQYTHAAIWTTMAFAALGDRKRAWELFAMINPVNHSSSKAKVDVYKVEPYVVAADVYAIQPHTGRGGWTWYTGSAGWMYRLILESLVGIRLECNVLHVEPCLPPDWNEIKINYRYRETLYRIRVSQTLPSGSGSLVTVDGQRQNGNSILLVDDRQDHSVEFATGLDVKVENVQQESAIVT